MMSKPRRPEFKYQLLMTGSLFFGLFFLEYPPIFLLGYWSWSGVVHKTLSGALIVLNLFVTQYAVRRWGFFRHGPKVGGEKTQETAPQVEHDPEENR